MILHGANDEKEGAAATDFETEVCRAGQAIEPTRLSADLDQAFAPVAARPQWRRDATTLVADAFETERRGKIRRRDVETDQKTLGR